LKLHEQYPGEEGFACIQTPISYHNNDDDGEGKKRRLVAIFILIRDIPNGRSPALRHTAGKKPSLSLIQPFPSIIPSDIQD
jgi:hypothetical protein